MARRRINRSGKDQESFIRKERERNKQNQKRRRLNKTIKQKNKLKKKSQNASIRKQRSRFLKKTPNYGQDGEHYLGPMNVLCCHCGAKHFLQECISNKGNSFSDCCSHGAVPPACFDDFPKELQKLFQRKHKYSSEFLNYIRGYNTSFSFASFNANLVNFSGRRPGPYCFKVKGQIYYQINTALYPQPDSNATYGQLFILDPSTANHQRMENIPGLDIHILQIIEKILQKENQFAKSYNMMVREIEHLKKTYKKKGQTIPEVKMSFVTKQGINSRRYNAPQTDEVAAIFTTTAEGEIPHTYVTIRNINTNTLEYVSSMDSKCEPLLYPLFYPRGNLGWHKDLMQLHKMKRITRLAYTKNYIAIRSTFNPLLYGAKLFQQWLVDSYVKIERDRIEYCRSHQEELKSKNYQGVIDFMQKESGKKNCTIGKITILPATFIGSPRNMAQNYQDAMAIVRKYGKPDLFITMTCNPNWREIKENLLPNQQPSDRPDLVARVFNLKKEALLYTIINGQTFGEVEAYVYVIEFQKRGLPHMHLLITLKRNYKIVCPEVIDKFISAEIPDPEEDPVLHKIVMQNMIHGPCGDWCLKDGKCSKHFPKPYQDHTIIGDDNYPSYRRRNTGKYYERPNNYMVDNRFVVPYSPELLKRFNCHINVELVSSIKSVKYLHKYIYKGYDAATITMQGNASNMNEINYDEINEHIEARYVGPVEAVWRILSKKLQGRSHAIVRLPIHLPNQNCTIDPDEENPISDDIIQQKNMLIDYFNLNLRDEEARKHLYVDIPTYYTYKKITNGNTVTYAWIRRKTSFKTIGRMYSVNPCQVELFRLRLLLLTRKGGTSFTDLRTIDGIEYSTYTEACVALGLIADDDEWKRAMHEAEVWMMPFHLRRLFVRILIHCQPLYPEQLWQEFKEAMSEDFLRVMSATQSEIRALQQIKQFLEEEGKDMAHDYPSMPKIKNTEMIIDDENYYDELLLKANLFYDKLNEDQRKIINEINESINNQFQDRKCFYIDGPGGSGKTFLYITLWYIWTARKVQVNTMAYTGIAATLLPSGKTVHKTLGLPVPLYHDSESTIKIGTKEAKNLEKSEIFIWDEAPMAPRYALEVMDRTLRKIMNNDKPFGGKTVILGGDFRQLLPVNIGGKRSETINLSIKYSALWKYFRKFKLSKNMRILPEELQFSQFLLNVGDGTFNDADDNLDISQYCTFNSEDTIAQDIYGKIIKEQKFKEMSKYAILSARNIDVDEINENVSDLLNKDSEEIYTSVDSIEKCNQNDQINSDIVPEYLNSLSPASLPPHCLRLRRYSVVMLIRNLSINEGLCNGTRLLILDLRRNLLRCEILTGDKCGEIIFLNRITLICEDFYPFTFSRRQFPIKLAFAMTINKAQGLTFDKIGIDLKKDVFNHGQLYVALSRVRSWKAVQIYIGNQRTSKTIKNFVYKEILDKPYNSE